MLEVTAVKTYALDVSNVHVLRGKCGLILGDTINGSQVRILLSMAAKVYTIRFVVKDEGQ
jgi:hypothetical protein